MVPDSCRFNEGGGGGTLIKVGTDVRARALGISGVNFCPGITFCELNFARALGVWQLFTKKKCVIFNKRVTKVTYLLKMSNFGTLKFMKTCSVIRFWGIFCLGIGFFGEILSGLGFALAAHPYLPLLGSPPPRHKSLDERICYIVEW